MNLPAHIVDEITLESLKEHYHMFSTLEPSVPYFSHNTKEEKKQVNKMKKSFKTIIEYYGGKVE